MQMYQKDIQPIGVVRFAEIDGKTMSKVYRHFTGVLSPLMAEAGKMFNENKNPLDADLSKVLNGLSSESFDFIRDAFFEHMICEGYEKNLKVGMDKLYREQGVFVEIPLMIEAFKYYLLEQLKLAIQDGGALASLRSIFPGVNQALMTQMAQKFSGIQS